MTIEELKTELELKTDFRFEIKDGFFGKELRLVGLNKKSEVKVSVKHNSKTGELFYFVDGETKNPLLDGFGYSCGTINETIGKIIYAVKNPDYGYKQPDLNKQIKMELI